MTENKRDVVLFQFNPGLYNNQSYLPYSVGMLWAYAKTYPEIEAGYRNAGFSFLREDPESIVERIEHVDVAAFSAYLWNWEISNAAAIAIKQRFPDALVVFGGPSVPNDSRELLKTHPHIDVAVHGEGEETFADILKADLAGRDFSDIPGLSFIGPDGYQCLQVARDPMRNLDVIPSPYLTGIFDHLFEMPLQFQATWETNRGCPYKCTFCYWGTDFAFVQKLRQFSMDRLYEELDYFGRHNIGHIYLADANFGIIPRDLDLAKRLAQVKASNGGYPAKFKANYAKNSTERVVDIARILNREKLDRGISLAVQSMDEETLVNIKRKNMKIDSFARFMHQYQKEGIPAYVELILGMPGETYDSFRDGIARLLEAGAHDALFLHKGIVLPNTEMADPDYRERHGIVTRRLPATLTHSSKNADNIQEYEDLIIATRTMPHDEWRRTYLFAWAMQTCHIMRLTQVPAIYASVYQGFDYGRFYEALVDYSRRHPETIFARELAITEETLSTALEGEGFDRVLPEFSDIVWPPEEASFLRICLELDRFFTEFAEFMCDLAAHHGWTLDPVLLDDLLAYQKALVVKWDRDGSAELDLQHSVHEFYRAQLEGKPGGLKCGRFQVRIVDDLLYAGDKERFSREIAFWGRRGGHVTYSRVHQQALEVESELEAVS